MSWLLHVHHSLVDGKRPPELEQDSTSRTVEKIQEYVSYIKFAPQQIVFSLRNATENGDGGASGAPLGLGLLIAMVTAALAIAIIALLISKMRRRQQGTDSTDIELDVPTDPYMQAIMFPTEPRPEWHRHLRQVFNKAGQKIFKKGEAHDTTIPENLRHQLKHIYVY